MSCSLVRRNELGFTLIELSFVAILLALLGSIVYGSITMLVRSKNALEERRVTERTAEAILARIGRELENHFSEPLRPEKKRAQPAPEPVDEDGEADEEPAESVSLMLGRAKRVRGAQADSLHFTTLGNPASSSLGNPGVIEVEYRLQQNDQFAAAGGLMGPPTFTLIREEAPAGVEDIKVVDPRRFRAALTDRVRSLQFRYRVNRRWINQWSPRRDNFPDAVEITISLATDSGSADTYRTAVTLFRGDDE